MIMNTELIFSILIFIVPILILSTLIFIVDYPLRNKKKHANDNLVNHIAEDFHNDIGVKIYE